MPKTNEKPETVVVEYGLDPPDGCETIFFKLRGTCLTLTVLCCDDPSEEWEGEIGTVVLTDPRNIIDELKGWMFQLEDAENGDLEHPGHYSGEIEVMDFGYVFRDNEDSEPYCFPESDGTSVTIRAYSTRDARMLITIFEQLYRCLQQAGYD